MRNIMTLLTVLIMLACTSCEKEQKWWMVYEVEMYGYENGDTIVSADSHEFTLKMAGNNQLSDWYIDNLDTSPRINDWGGDHLPENDSLFINPWHTYIIWAQAEPGYIEKDTYGNDWITVKKILTDKSPELKVTVKRNDSNQYRAFRLEFRDGGKDDDNITTIGIGHITIVQKPMPDMEPFEMKIRYKGDTYSSNAHLNINEE